MNKLDVTPTKIHYKRSATQRKQLAISVDLSDHELYHKLQDLKIDSTEHCREACQQVIRYLAEKHGLIGKAG